MKTGIVLLFKNLLKDNVVRWILVLCIGAITTSFLLLSLFLGLLIMLSLSLSVVLSIISLSYKTKIEALIYKTRNLCSRSTSQIGNKILECDICKIKHCKRHINNGRNNNPWAKLQIDATLDEAVESLFSKIIDSFVQSWFVLLSHDNDFVQTLKHSLREVTAHLIGKISEIDGPQCITKKICPILCNHIDTIEIMLQEGVLMDKMPNTFIVKDYPIHPAVCSRQAEKDYLRAVAKCLIPKIFYSEIFDSKIFFSLIRELIACWVLLPLMDVLSDPNLLNQMIIHVLNKTTNNKFNKIKDNNKKVEFLKKFVDRNKTLDKDNSDEDLTVLTENKKLYCFMQYLKKHGVIDLLRFYLDVDHLNKELQDSNTITDPAKLSALYQESEILLQDYEKIMNLNCVNNKMDVVSLTEAHSHIRNLLAGKWRKSFIKTPEYFHFIYGDRQIEYIDDYKSEDQNWGVSRIRSKIKGAFKGTIDGGSYEAIEIPTVWDALAEPNIPSSNPTIYNSVTQKLRRERGQNLDSFLLSFLQSLEHSTDVGEDIIRINEAQRGKKKLYSTDNSFVFGNLFSLDKISNKFDVSSYISFYITGPSRSALFIGLYQPRLAVLIKLLEVQLFEEKNFEYSRIDLINRQKKARQSMENTFVGTGELIHIFQSPSLNKHLMYCVFDSIISELYPELTM